MEKERGQNKTNTGLPGNRLEPDGAEWPGHAT